MRHPLMKNNISKKDLIPVIKHLKKKDPMLTQHKYVRQFEKNWSKWLGVKHSVFVNSGSSANFITFKILREITKKNEVILSPINWVSDISAVIYAGFKPVFVDINVKNLSADVEKIINKISKNTAAVLMTHILGFNGLNQKLLNTLKRKKIPLIEDTCESHGATFNKKRLGSFGLVSNFSFYYAHHLSTIEGGMICTNDSKIYEIARMFRSHGMVREIDSKVMKQKIERRNKDLNKKFIFEYPGFNMRNTEIGALIGLSQLKDLDKKNKIRARNFEFFLKNLDKNYFYTDFDTMGNSNYALIAVLKKNNYKIRDKFEKLMDKNRIEYRRGTACGGNHLRQPYLKRSLGKINLKNFKNADHMHFYGYYIGNYPSLEKKQILMLTKILNQIKND